MIEFIKTKHAALKAFDQLVRVEKEAAERRRELLLEIGSILRTERLSRKISLRSLSQRLSLSPAFVCDLERGFRPWSEARIKSFINQLTAES